MDSLDIRFHLKPIAERFSLDELQKREEKYLFQNPISDLKLPPPSPDLALIVVIPVFNEEYFIGKSLNSLISQNLPSKYMEILVVDNGSTDHSCSIVLENSINSKVPIYLISQPVKGCLNAIKMGMDAAIHRFSQVSLPQNGIIASIDADNQVGSYWALTIINTIAERRVDMLRGTTRVVPPLTPEVETLLKILCDLGNRANAYSELARLRVKETLLGLSHHSLPLWLPRITGPNIAITRPAYIAVDGLDSRDPGDQASHLANPLLQMGGSFLLCETPKMTLDISSRFSHRIDNQGEFFGVARFGSMLELATKASDAAYEIRYPNPAKLEAGLQRIIDGLCSNNPKIQQDAKKLAAHLIDSPTDPNILYSYSKLPIERVNTSLGEAKASFIDMTTRNHGIDYRIAERFLVGREHLRIEVLSFGEQPIISDQLIAGFLKRAGAPFAVIPPHIQQIAATLQKLRKDDKAQWYDAACQEMEKFYAKIEAD